MFPQRNAFTLTELLVVISILAILAGLLLPSIGMVRKAAARSSATTTMGQIGLGVACWSNDNEGMLPGPLLGGQLTTYTRAGDQLGYYLYPFMDGVAPPADWSSVKLAKLVDKYREKQGFATAWARNNQFFPSGKRSSPAGVFDPNGYPAVGSTPATSPAHISQITHASMAIFLQDMTSENSTWANLPAKPIYGKYITLYYDNHTGLSDQAYSKMQTFW